MNRPFDAARYAGLLEGLEATEIAWSKLERTKRIDSEYFLKRHRRNQSVLLHHALQSVADCAKVADGNHFAISDEFVEDGIPYYRGQDVSGQFFVEQAAPIGITRKAFDAPYMKRSHLREGDVLLSIIGTIGESSLVSSKREATCSCKLAILRPRKIVPAFLATYLRCEYGRSQTSRLTRGAVQMGLLLEDMDQLLLPVASKDFQQGVETIVFAAHAKYDRSSATLTAAEHMLLGALCLVDWQPPQPLSYVRSSRDAFAAGRLDAEHFKPGCAELEAHLRATGSACTLKSLLTINERGTQPDYADAGLPVVNSKHVANNEVRLDDENRTARHGARMLRIRHGDVLMNGTGVGTIGRAAPYLHVSEALPDNHVTVLRPKTGAIDPVYLAVFLNSLAGKLQVEKRLRGSSGQIELYPNDIAQFLVWQAPSEVQLSIRQSVETAFAAKQRAAALLDAARRAVEIAIEDSEAAALDWLLDARARAEGAP